MSKLRVWWIPQVGIEETFYVPVSTAEEGKKTLDLLAAYDAFQLQNNVKSDYTNVGGLQMFDEEEGEWNDWYLETEDDYFDDVVNLFLLLIKQMKLMHLHMNYSSRLIGKRLRE